LGRHGSHLTYQFDTARIENDIMTLCIPTHLSYLYQLLNVFIFAPLKKSYTSILNTALGFPHVDKHDFMKAFLRAWIEAYKSTSIQNEFAAAGLVPLDPKQVLAKINIQLKTLMLPGSSHGPLQLSCL
jgi:hypothetical protein